MDERTDPKRLTGVRKLAVLGVLAALGVLLFALVLHIASREIAPSPEAAPSTTPSATVRAVEAQRDPVQAGDESAERVPIVLTERAAPEQQGDLLVEVVDELTGEPVSNARLLVEREVVDPIDWYAAEERFGDVEPTLASGLGVEHATDEHGLLWLPRPKRDTWITANVGHRHGESRVRAGTASARIEIASKHCLEIEVVDRAGRAAADVRLVLLARDEVEWSRVWTGLTDEAGRATVDAIDDKLESADSRLALGATLVRSEPEQIEFTLATTPVEPVKLLIADTGAVELSITDTLGRRIALEAELRLELDDENSVGLPLPMKEGWLQCLSTRTGRARYEHVGLDLALTASAYTRLLEIDKRDFAGPRRSGEVVQVTVSMASANTIVRGRLLDGDRHALGDHSVSAQATRGFSDGSVGIDSLFEATTAANGTFAIRIGSAWENVEIREVTMRAERAGSPPANARMAWPPAVMESSPMPHPVFDLGDVIAHLEPLAPMMVAGRVIDGRGMPVEGAELEIRPLPPTAESQWLDSGVSSETDGRYEIRSTFDTPRFRVRAVDRHSRSSEAIEVSLGAVDVVLVLGEPGSIIGRVALPERLNMNGIDLSFPKLDVELGDGPRSRSCDLNDEGIFRTVVSPGHYRVSAWFGEHALAEIADVEVRAGEPTHLAPIDVRDKLHAIAIELSDERGEHIGQGTVDALDGEDRTVEADLGRDGVAVLASLTPQVDVVASALGRRTTLFRGVSTGARLTLSAGVAAAIRAPVLGAEAEDYQLGLDLRYAGDDQLRRFTDETHVVLAADGRAAASLPLPGEYVIKITLIQKLSGARFPVALDSAPTLVAREGSEEIVLTIDPTALQDSLRRAKQE